MGTTTALITATLRWYSFAPGTGKLINELMEQSNFARPPALAHAEALISDHTEDPAWLQVKARADLLDRHYQSAIDSLLRAQETQPERPGLLVDLGTAYYLSGTLDNKVSNLGRAVDALQAAVRSTPDDPTALFNLGLALRRHAVVCLRH